MVASMVPTSTVSPSWTRICVTTPSAGLGTSVSTLSVEISRSGSSRPIGSPTCLSHFVTVPSETDTPIWGITTSVCVPVDTVPPSSVGGELSQGVHDVIDLREIGLLERRREGYGHVRRGDPHDRRVEVLERLLRDRRGDLGAEACGAGVLVEHKDLGAALDALEDALLVPRDQRSEIENFRFETFLCELVCRLGRGVHHRTPCDDGGVVAGPVHPRVTEGERIP